jgi:hypothetical protein
VAKFIVTAPDGSEYEVDAPEGATEKDAIDFLTKELASQPGGPAATMLMGETEQRPPSFMEFAVESAKRGLTGFPSSLTAGGAQQTGTFAGAFPTQPEMLGLTTENIQQRLGANPAMRPATTAQRFVGAGIESAFDPTTILGGPLKVGATGLRMGLATVPGVAGELGGTIGEQVAGPYGQIIGGITFALGSGFGVGKAAEGMLGKAKERIKDFNVEDLAQVEGLSRAQDLLAEAFKADPSLKNRLDELQKRLAFVTGEKSVLGVAGLDNIVLATRLKSLAENDIGFAADLKSLYSDIQSAVAKKRSELYPSATGEFPSATKKIEEVQTDLNERIKFIDKQLSKITSDLDIAGTSTPIQQGMAMQNLAVAREKAAREAISPEYDSVIGQASKQGAILPANETARLLATAEDLFQSDPWGRQSDLLRLVKTQSDKFSALRSRMQPTGADNLPATLEADLSVGMDMTSLDSLKRRVAEDIRNVTSDVTRDKLRILQNRVDDALNQVQTANGNVNVNLRGENMTFGQAMTQLDTDYYNKIGIPFKDATAVQKISSQEYAERISPLIASSPTATRQFLRIAGDEGVPMVEKAIMSKLFNSAIGKNGLVDPVKLDKLITKNSNNGGFSDILDEVPTLKANLQDARIRSTYLTGEKVAIDDAAKEAKTRLGQSFLNDYDNRGVEGIVNNILGASGKGYYNKLTVDLKKLPSQDQANVNMALKDGMVTKMLDAPKPFDYLNQNKEAFIKVFGKDHIDKLISLADVSQLAKKIDVDRLNIRDVAIKETSALERMTGGVRPQQITGILVNQISSVFNKGFRILSLIGQANIDNATKEAQRKLFLDKDGLTAIENASTRLISKDGKDVDVKSLLRPGDVGDFANALGQGVLRSGYLGARSAMTQRPVEEEVTEPYFIYSP